MDPHASPELPIRIVALDQLLCGFDHVAAQGDPIEVRDHDETRRLKDPAGLPSCCRTVEPVPALSGSHDIERARLQPGSLSLRHPVLDLDAGFGIELPGLRQQTRVGVDADHAAASPGESAGQRPGSRSEIHHRLAALADAQAGKTFEEGIRESGPMLSVVFRGRAKVRIHVSVPPCGTVPDPDHQPTGKVRRPEEIQMTVRIPLPSDEELPAEVSELLAALPPLNVFRMVANAPASFRPFMEFAASILIHSEFDPRKREIAVLRVAHVTRSEYEWAQHVRLGRNLGLKDEEIEAIACDGAVDGLDEEGNLLCRVAEEISRDVRLSDDALAEIRKRYGVRGASELILCCSYFNMLSRFLESMGVPLEEEDLIGSGTPSSIAGSAGSLAETNAR